MLPARYPSDGLSIPLEIQRSILNSLVQFHELVVGLLYGVLVVPLRVQLLVAQGQQFLGAGAGFVQRLPQSIGAHAVFLQGLAKATCLLDLLFCQSAGGQCYLLQCIGVGVALVTQLVREHLLPAGVEARFHPVVQGVDGRHKDVIQPVRQLRPGVGCRFLVAKESLEDGHPF